MTTELTPTTAAAASGETTEPVSTGLDPVLAGFHPDPSIVRVGSDYYLANSSFEYFPAVPIHRSTDLVTWELIGHALHREDQFVPGHARASKGVFAPTLRHHDGRFWMITTDVPAGGGQLVVSAEHAAGPWSAVTTIEGLDGIDPDLAWDEDGTCFVTFCAVTDSISAIAQARVDLHRGAALEKPRVIWRGTGLAFPEGPHLYRVGEWWYLLIAEGGTERGHAVSIARSHRPDGPFASYAGNPILSHRSLAHPVQNTGHADLVETPDGEWAMVFLGVRPGGRTPWYHVNGRETFLAGIDWHDGWPLVDEGRYTRPAPDRSWTDHFAAGELHPRWITPGNGFARVSRDGGQGVILAPGADGADPLDAIMIRPTDARWTFTTVLEVGDGSAAVRLRLDDEHHCEIAVTGSTARAFLRIGPVRSELGARTLRPAPEGGPRIVTVTVTAADSETGPDDIVLAVADEGPAAQLARFDGRYLSTEVAGGFTGRTIGIRPLAGATRVLSADYRARRDGIR